MAAASVSRPGLIARRHPRRSHFTVANAGGDVRADQVPLFRSDRSGLRERLLPGDFQAVTSRACSWILGISSAWEARALQPQIAADGPLIGRRRTLPLLPAWWGPYSDVGLSVEELPEEFGDAKLTRLPRQYHEPTAIGCRDEPRQSLS
jgi:hypothetical protein